MREVARERLRAQLNASSYLVEIQRGDAVFPHDGAGGRDDTVDHSLPVAFSTLFRGKGENLFVTCIGHSERLQTVSIRYDCYYTSYLLTTGYQCCQGRWGNAGVATLLH